MDVQSLSGQSPFADQVPVVGLTGRLPPSEPLWVSPDACRLYFQARDTSNGFLVYVAERLP